MRSVTKTPSHSHVRAVRKKRAKPRESAVLTDRVIDGFTLKEKIGEGGTAVVYAAEDREKRRFAVKIALSKKFNGILDNESERLGQLDHPAILKGISSGTTYGRSYIATEYLEGQSLAHEMGKPGIIPWEKAKKIVMRLCDALHELHRKGLAHRDVTPGNIHLLPDGSIKLLDFGLTQEFDQCFPQKPGSIEGSPKYMAPEAAAGLKHDHRADIYSTGVILYALMTGDLPLRGDSEGETLMKHINEDPQKPSERAKHLDFSEGADEVVMKALDKDPTKRYQSILELKEAISEISIYHGLSCCTAYATLEAGEITEVGAAAAAC